MNNIRKMREALEELIMSANDSDAACYGTLSASFVRQVCEQAIAAAEAAQPASAQQMGEHEPVGFFNGVFAGDVNGRMKFSVTAYGALPIAGAKLYTAPPATACSVQLGPLAELANRIEEADGLPIEISPDAANAIRAMLAAIPKVAGHE